MKSMKKLVTLLLSLVMLCALALPAMADETTPSITINGAVAGHTYTAYQVFSGVYYKGDRQTDTSKDKEYLSDVEWGKDVDGEKILKELHENALLKASFEKKTSAEDVAYVLQGFKDKSQQMDEFARVVGNHLSTTDSGKVTIDQNGTNNKITGLTAGYYFVKDTDSNAIKDGEIATKFLVEVVGNANVTVKAQAPEFEKKVVNGSADKGTSVNVGDKVTFQLTAKVPDMASFDKYTFTMHDTLSKGLTFNKDSVKVTVGDALVTDKNYTLTYPTANGSKDTFTIAFSETQLKNLVKHTGGAGEKTDFGATIVVEYTATLNEEALNKDVETNKAYLEYSNDPSNSTSTGKTEETPTEIVHVYNFNIDVDKYDGTDGTTTDKKLEKAVFVLYRLNGATTKEYYKRDGTTGKITWVSANDNPTQKTTNVSGKTTFEGLKEGIYYLEEITAPDGYNKLKEPVLVEIKASYKEDGTLDTTVKDFKLQQDATHGNHYYQVQSIGNKAGAVLPSTGGIGTTIFYVLGSILALGAAVLLIAKKRMNGQDR